MKKSDELPEVPKATPKEKTPWGAAHRRKIENKIKVPKAPKRD